MASPFARKDIPLKQNSFRAHFFGYDQDSQCTNFLGIGNNPIQNFPNPQDIKAKTTNSILM